MLVVLTFFGKSEPTYISCNSVFQNQDYLYIINDKHDVVLTYELKDIFHLTIRCE